MSAWFLHVSTACKDLLVCRSLAASGRGSHHGLQQAVTRHASVRWHKPLALTFGQRPKFSRMAFQRNGNIVFQHQIAGRKVGQSKTPGDVGNRLLQVRGIRRHCSLKGHRNGRNLSIRGPCRCSDRQQLPKSVLKPQATSKPQGLSEGFHGHKLTTQGCNP